MKETFLYSFRAVAPILLLMLLGYTIRHTGWWDNTFFSQTNKLCFRVFLPVQLFCNIYELESLVNVNIRIIVHVCIGTAACMLLGVAAAKLFVTDPDQKGIIAQASFRSNQAVFGIPLATSLGGAHAATVASLIMGITTPLYNFLAVLSLSYYSARQAKRNVIRHTIKTIVTNPLIIACVAGFICLGLRQLQAEWGYPGRFLISEQLPSVFQPLQYIRKVATPLLLVSLGAGLDFKSVGNMVPVLVLGVFLRLIVAPALVIGSALLLRDYLQMSFAEIPGLLGCASPVAVVSAVMVQEIGGDVQLANQIVAWSSILSLVTLFILIFVLRFLGVV